MDNDTRDILDKAEEAIDMQSDSFEMSDFPQTLVTEKIIFVVDIVLLTSEHNTDNILRLLSLLKVYFNLKKKISVKPVQFECLIYSCNNILHFNINSEKNLDEAVLSIKNMDFDGDMEPLKIDEVFDRIAMLVEFPDPDCSQKCLPPNWVYHVIWLFGRNLHMPTMENPNSFDFLMMTPYFALDIIYLCNQNLKGNMCNKISTALAGLNENGKGYFLAASVLNKKGSWNACLAKCLGHPLIRTPQSRANYNIAKLSKQIEIVENNNDEE